MTRGAENLEHVLRSITAQVETHNPALVFVDALSALTSTGVAVMMTCELENRYTDPRFSPYGTAFLTDVIIVQRYIELDSRLRRMMAAVKTRASAHSDAMRLFTIDEEGFHLGDMLENLQG